MPLIDKVSVGNNKQPNIAIKVVHKDKTVDMYKVVESTGATTKYKSIKE